MTFKQQIDKDMKEQLKKDLSMKNPHSNSPLSNSSNRKLRKVVPSQDKIEDNNIPKIPHLRIKDDYNQIYGEKDLIEQFEQGRASREKEILDIIERLGSHKDDIGAVDWIKEKIAEKPKEKE